MCWSASLITNMVSLSWRVCNKPIIVMYVVLRKETKARSSRKEFSGLLAITSLANEMSCGEGSLTALRSDYCSG
jgi:hypothetical protein